MMFLGTRLGQRCTGRLNCQRESHTASIQRGLLAPNWQQPSQFVTLHFIVSDFELSKH